jgi:hypothetical protein
MALKPWYKLVTPREDLREGKPFDASDFAVHLEHVRENTAPQVYRDPEQFLERTYLTKNLLGLAAEVVRRLSGEKTETSAVFNMTTQFGGGKTHALTLLYHLAKNGPDSHKWTGVQNILSKAGVGAVPQAQTAVFVGTEFDSISGKGGENGTPLRKTPWGEIAYQLSGNEGFATVVEHEKQMTAPSGEIIRRFLPKDKPCLILMDELMNYISRNRKSGLAAQLYNFIQNLSEEARAHNNMVLAVSVPASEYEMNPDDRGDFERLKKLLDRLGKAVIMSAEAETSEIIRRRLFEWYGLPDEAKKVIAEYADWVLAHRQQLPNWFPIDNASEEFAATYPFHPMAISVFQRKWQALPRFQRTRGILRLLALWVSQAYQEGYKGAHSDPMIGIGTAPLDNPMFRAAVFEQLGEEKLEVAVTTDIAGRKDSNAISLDKEAVDTIKKVRLHRKVATSVFFESNGGQLRAEATVPEIRLAVAEPELEIGNVETVLEALTESCYYLSVERNRYRFSQKENLNKRFADRRASIQKPKVEERVCTEIQKVFAKEQGIDLIFFPEKSSEVPDRPVLTFVVLGVDNCMKEEKKTLELVESMTREYGTSARTFKSALVWCVADDGGAIRDEARKVLAWEDIQDEAGDLSLDETQERELGENVKKARRDLKECIWRSYRSLMLLGKDNSIKTVNLGLVHSSAANTMVGLLIDRLHKDGEVEESPSPNFLVRNWPPAFIEWSTKSARDAFFASPQFPRLLDADAIKQTIARGVENKIIGYVGKTDKGRYEPFYFGEQLNADEIEISEEMFIVKGEEAKKHIEPPKLTSLVISPSQVWLEPGKKQALVVKGLDQHGREMPVSGIQWEATGGTIDGHGVYCAGMDEGNFVVAAAADTVRGIANVTIGPKEKVKPPIGPLTQADKLTWSGEVPPQKWMNFYTRVVSKFAAEKDLRLEVTIEVSPESGISTQKVEETKTALRELGLNDNVITGRTSQDDNEADR